MIKLIVLIAFLPSIWAFVYVLRGRSRNSRRYSASMKDNIKLPIIQFFDSQLLQAEIVYGSDPISSQSKLESALKSFAKDICESSREMDIVNIYSDDHLQSTLLSNKNCILKLYELNCAKCMQFESEFQTLHERYSEKMVFVQARASDVPAHTQRTLQSLSGASRETAQVCDICSGSGGVECPTCNGSGMVTRGALSVFCPICTGKKVIRCQKCGGKCLNC